MLTRTAAPSHLLHDQARTWPLTSCYADLWIEMLHGLGLDPHPMLGFTASLQWEGDQFTFLKPHAADLDVLYGLHLQELALWGDVERHVAVQLAQGRPVLIEVDALHLPDLAGSSYGREHSKTTIAIVRMDVRAGRCSYVHNASRAELAGADYDAVLRGSSRGLPLPPYAELVKRRPVPSNAPALHETALDLLRAHVSRLGGQAQIPLFRAAFPQQLDELRACPERFHGWAFNTLRQFGAGAELLGSLLGWLEARRPMEFSQLEAAAMNLATTAKALQFRVARMVAHDRRDGCNGLFDVLEADEARLAAGLRGRLA